MQSTARALAVVFGLSSTAAAGDYDDKILEGCPNLKDGAVSTETIQTDMSFHVDSWNTISHLNGQITHENASVVRDNLLFDSQSTYRPNGDLIMINSVGGITRQADMIIRNMERTGSVITVCASEASSSAFAVLASGVSRYAYKDCLAITHSTTLEASGALSLNDISEAEKTIKRDEKPYKETILDKTAIDETCYAALTQNGDIPLDSQSLLALGVVDGVLNYDGTMTVRSGDPRIEFQACMSDKIKVDEPTQEHINAAAEKCTPSP